MSSVSKNSKKNTGMVLLDPPIQIGLGTWHIFNAFQLGMIGLNQDQIRLVTSKRAKLTDFIADPQAAADAAFSDTK